MDHRVNCITKSSPQGGHDHITHIGIQSGRLTKAATIRRIESKTDQFHVYDAKTAKKAYVGVVYPQNGQPYLRTHADGEWNDNLLALPACGNLTVLE